MNQVHHMADNINVLVAEDFEFNQLVIKQLLRELGFRFIVVNNGREAIEQLDIQRFDIVFMDIEMPIMDGIEATRVIKSSSSKEIRSVPVVGFTGHKDPDFIAELKNIGFIDVVVKPFQKKDIEDKINMYVLFKEKEVVEASNQEVRLDADGSVLYDLTNLRAFSDDDEEFVLKMLKYFIENSPKVIERMRDSFGGNDWAELRMEAHKFNSELGLLGIQGMIKTAEQIEAGSTDNPDVEKLSACIESLHRQGKLVVEKLKSDFNIN